MKEETKGTLKHLEHIWEDGIFKMSAVHIEVCTDEVTDSSRQEFYGKIPESILGKKVYLYQEKKGKDLFQKLTVQDEGNTYQIQVSHKL